MTQEFGDFMDEWRTKNNYQLSKFWVGPFDVSIAITHPSYLNKQLLKCMLCIEVFTIIYY